MKEQQLFGADKKKSPHFDFRFGTAFSKQHFISPKKLAQKR